MAVMNNSLGPRNDERKRPSLEEREKHLKQFDGVKQIRKKENVVAKWFRDMFFSGRTAKDIVKEVAETQIIPQMKDNFRNSVVSMLDLKIYKDHRPATPSGGQSGNFMTNYVQYSNKPAQQKASLEKTQEENKKIIESGYECPAFKSKTIADDFLRSMHEYVSKFDTMSVHDLALMQRKNIPYTWDAWGWDREEILGIKDPIHITSQSTPWIIQLPRAHQLD